MEESKQQPSKLEQANNATILAKINMMMVGQDEVKSEVRHLRDVVIGNGDSSSILNQVKELQFGQAIAKSDRERMEKQIVKQTECIARIEKDEIEGRGLRKTSHLDQEKILKRLDKIEARQEEHGTLIAAFRNRIIGIVAFLSLLAGAGAGFAVAAKFLGDVALTAP
jgi:hypothetical protein